MRRDYIDYIFPSFNIRFIALSDNVDTADRNSTALEMMPIINLVNANYGQSKTTLTDIIMLNSKKQANRNCLPVFYNAIVNHTLSKLLSAERCILHDSATERAIERPRPKLPSEI